jgi:hypothetical protein
LKTTADALKAKTRLQSFVNTLTKLDQKLSEDQNTRKHDAEDAARSLKRSGSSVGLSESSRCAPYSRGERTTTSHAQSSSSSTSRPPKLTDCERKYLEMYNGCKKCRNFYMPEGHSCEFPGSDGYVERTMAMVNEARKWIKLPNLPVPRDEVAMPVGAVSNMPSSNNSYMSAPAQPSTAAPPLPIAAVLGMSSYPCRDATRLGSMSLFNLDVAGI